MLQNDQLVYIGLELAIACLAVAGNILVCWAVCLNSNLQSITNFFVVSLAAADIAVGLLAIPLAITVGIGFCASFHGCLFIACFVLVLTHSSIFSLLAIAVDRYIAIKSPLRYNSLVTGPRAKGVVALCWVLSAGIGFTPMMGWNQGWNTTAAAAIASNHCPEGMRECLFEGVVTLDYMVYFNFLGCVLVPLVLMLVIYAQIFKAARRQLRLMMRKVTQTSVPAGQTSPSGSCRSILQKEVHAAKALAIIVGLFAVCWLPLHIINCFNFLCQNCGRPHIWVMNIAIILSHANSVVNPFIYAYRIREFRLTFRRILYRHILGQRDGHGFRVGSGDDRGNRCSSIMQTSSRNSKEGSTCSTVVNNYVQDPSLDRTPSTTHEASSQWTSKLDALQSSYIPDGRHKKGNLSTMQQHPCVIGFSAKDGGESITCLGSTINILEVRDSGSCITFVNDQALSPKPTGTAHSTELTKIS